MFFPSSFAPLAFSLRVQFLSGLFSVWLPYPGLNPLASIVTLRYSFRLTPTSTSRTVLICVVGLSFCFPHYSSLCLTAYNSSVMALFGSAAGAHGEVMLSPITR